MGKDNIMNNENEKGRSTFMSKWDYFKKSVGIIADKTVSKTRELTDTASLKIKIATKEADRDAEYKALGKLTYARLKKLNIPGAESITERISGCIEKIDTLNAEISALKAQEKAKRAAKEAEKAAKEAKRAEEEAEEDGELVMEQFNQARQSADREYEAAKEAVKDAKSATQKTNTQIDASASEQETTTKENTSSTQSPIDTQTLNE